MSRIPGVAFGCLLLAATAPATTSNQPPTVTTNAGGEIPLGPTASLIVRGKDPEGEPLTYRWRLLDKPAGSQAAIDSPETAIAGLRPDQAGRYRVSVTVSDGANRVVKSLEFSAAAPTQSSRYRPLPKAARAHQPGPASRRKQLSPPPTPCAAPQTGADGTPTVTLGWQTPRRRADAQPLQGIARFHVYRAALPPDATRCAPYRHCLRPYATLIPHPGNAQRFIDHAPLAQPACYAVRTRAIDGSSSPLGNAVMTRPAPRPTER